MPEVGVDVELLLEVGALGFDLVEVGVDERETLADLEAGTDFEQEVGLAGGVETRDHLCNEEEVVDPALEDVADGESAVGVLLDVGFEDDSGALVEFELDVEEWSDVVFLDEIGVDLLIKMRERGLYCSRDSVDEDAVDVVVVVLPRRALLVDLERVLHFLHETCDVLLRVLDNGLFGHEY